MKLETIIQEIKIVTVQYTPEEYLELEEKSNCKNEKWRNYKYGWWNNKS